MFWACNLYFGGRGEYYHFYLNEDDVKKISQYDFKAQGFHLMESDSDELIEFGIDTAPSGLVKQLLTYLKSCFEEKMRLTSELDSLAIQMVINRYGIILNSLSNGIFPVS